MQDERILTRTLGTAEADVFHILTRIVVVVQVLASSQREPVPRETPGTASGRSQLLAQPQALRSYVLVTVIDQYSSSALLSSKGAANGHVCGEDNRHMPGLDISRFKVPLRQLRPKDTTPALVLLIIFIRFVVHCWVQTSFNSLRFVLNVPISCGVHDLDRLNSIPLLFV